MSLKETVESLGLNTIVSLCLSIKLVMNISKASIDLAILFGGLLPRSPSSSGLVAGMDGFPLWSQYHSVDRRLLPHLQGANYEVVLHGGWRHICAD